MVIGPVAITCYKVEAHLSLGSFVGCLLLPTPPKQPVHLCSTPDLPTACLSTNTTLTTDPSTGLVLSDLPRHI